MKKNLAPDYRMRNKGSGKGEIFLYGVIGEDMWGDGITATRFAQDLRALGNVSTLDVRINSEGGDVFAGKAMYSLLNEHKAEVVMHVDGLAASAASFVAMAGDRIEISEGGFMMIHDVYGACRGGAEDMRAYAALLDNANSSVIDVYAARTANDKAKIKKWMAEETWFNAADAVANKFADKMVSNLKVSAQLHRPDSLKHIPLALRDRRNAIAAKLAKLAR